MSNLKVWQKLALMGVVFMLPFAVVAYRMTSWIDERGVSLARQELRGLEYYMPTLTLVTDLQRLRGMSNAMLRGDNSFGQALVAKRTDIENHIKKLDEVDARHGAALRAAEKWKAVRAVCTELLAKASSLTPDESFDRYSRLIADLLEMMRDLGDASDLTIDADISRGHLIDVVLFEGPELSEWLAQARGYGSGVIAAKKRTSEEIERLRRYSVLVAFLGEKLDASLEEALAASPLVAAELEADVRASSDAALDSIGQIARLADGQSFDMDAAHYFTTLSRSIDALAAMEGRIVVSLTRMLNDHISALRRELLQTLGLTFAGLCAVGLIGFFIMRDITVPLKRVVAVANQLAVGNLTTQAQASGRKDEIGELARAFDQMVAGMKGITTIAEKIASGDLSVTVTHRSDRDAMGTALSNMVERLSTLLGEVHRSGIQVNTSVNDIAATAKQQQATASEIAATTSEIGATSKEISATSKELVRTMNEVGTVAEQSASLAGSGQAGLTRMEETMRQVMDAAGAINARLAVLNEKAGNINQVVTTITKVADQTNLLSLNAAIEAEKAGEYGRGFSVVATEIRRLADQTAVATYDIEQMVKAIQSAVTASVMGMDKFSEEVRRGIEDVHQVGNQLSQIIQDVQALAPRFEAVSEGMEAQATGAEQITNALAQLSEAAQETVESLRQSTQAIDGLNQAATGMHRGVSHFRLAA